MKKIASFIVVLLVVYPVFIFAGINPTKELNKANDWYKKGSYKDAVLGYEKIVNAGFRSAELYFNLGNTYYKLKDYPNAVLYFEKAKLLKPNDDGINYNLELTRTLTGDKVDALEPFFIKRWIHSVINLMSFETWAWISLISFILMLFFAGFYLFSRTRSIKMIGFWIAIVLLIISIKTIVFASIQYNYMMDSKTAIVMSPTVTVKSSPSDTGSDLFVIHDGTKVSILQKSGDWAKVRIADGNSGWIKVADYKGI